MRGKREKLRCSSVRQPRTRRPGIATLGVQLRLDNIDGFEEIRAALMARTTYRFSQHNNFTSGKKGILLWGVIEEFVLERHGNAFSSF